MADDIISHLKKRDGSISGLKWTKQDTDMVAKQNGIPEKMEEHGKHYCSIKFWVAMNYVYAVHYNINRSTNGYIELALDELCNHNISFEDLVKKVVRKF